MRTSLGYLIISLSVVVGMTTYAQVSIPENLDYYQHILKQVFITQDGTKPTEQNLDSIINDDQGNVYIKNGVYLGDAKPSTVDKGLFVDGRSRIGKDLYTQGNMGIGIQPTDKKALVKGNVHIGDMITVDGKLGVNVDTPLANLHVQGDVKFTGLPQADDATQGLSIGLDGMVGTYGFAWKKNGSVIQNLNNGNVGIGTQDPQAKLHVVGNVKTTEEGGPQDGAQMDTVILSYVGLEDEVDTKGCDIKKDIAEALGKTEDCPKPECTVPNCKECTASAAGSGTSAGGSGSAGGTCALCEEGYDLKDGKCEKTCSDSAGTGKDCNECKEGFVKKDNKCVLPTCDTYTGSSACNADVKCIWSEEKKVCEDKKGCSTYSEEPKCSADPKCEWDTEKKMCEDKGSGSACTDYKDQPKCDADTKCEWDTEKKVCEDKGSGSACTDYKDQPKCDADTKCEWDTEKKVCEEKQSTGDSACPTPKNINSVIQTAGQDYTIFEVSFTSELGTTVGSGIQVLGYENYVPKSAMLPAFRNKINATSTFAGYGVSVYDNNFDEQVRTVCNNGYSDPVSFKLGDKNVNSAVVCSMHKDQLKCDADSKCLWNLEKNICEDKVATGTNLLMPMCGGVNGTSVTKQPTAEEMCSMGTPENVLDVLDKYTWTCKGDGKTASGSVNCFANMTGKVTDAVTGACGSANQKKYADVQDFLLNGEPCKPGTIFQSSLLTDSWTWICKSDNGGKDSVQCTAGKGICDVGKKRDTATQACVMSGSMECPVTYMSDMDNGPDITINLGGADPSKMITAFEISVDGQKISLPASNNGSDSRTSPNPYMLQKRNYSTEMHSVTAKAICGASSTPALGDFTFAGVEDSIPCTNGATNAPACDQCSSGKTYDTTAKTCKDATCTNGATNAPACDQCSSGKTYDTTAKTCKDATCTNGATNAPACDQCSSGKTYDTTAKTCKDATCTNGATNAPACDQCSSGKTYDTTAKTCKDATCTNGATNAPACDQCPSGKTYDATAKTCKDATACKNPGYPSTLYDETYQMLCESSWAGSMMVNGSWDYGSSFVVDRGRVYHFDGCTLARLSGVGGINYKAVNGTDYLTIQCVQPGQYGINQ